MLEEHGWLDEEGRLYFGDSAPDEQEVQAATCEHLFGTPEQVARVQRPLTVSPKRRAWQVVLASGMLVLALAGCDSPPPETEPAGLEVTPSTTPTGPPGAPSLGCSSEVDDSELRGYVQLLQRFVTAARDGDCDTAWAMGNQNLHQAYGPKEVFCDKTLPAVAYVDLDLGGLDVRSPTYVTLRLPHRQSVSMEPGGNGRLRVATANFGVYERAVAD